MLWDKPKHIVMKTFIDVYKTTYYEGYSMILGWYYELIWPTSKTYYFNDSEQLAYVYFHIMHALKFVMPPTSHTVKGNYPTFGLPNENSSIDWKITWRPKAYAKWWLVYWMCLFVKSRTHDHIYERHGFVNYNALTWIFISRPIIWLQVLL